MELEEVCKAELFPYEWNDGHPNNPEDPAIDVGKSPSFLITDLREESVTVGEYEASEHFIVILSPYPYSYWEESVP